MPRLLVGLGHPDRGDDGVGPAVLARVTSLLPEPVPGLGRAVRAVTCTDPAELLQLWVGTGLAVVVDAVIVDPERARPGCGPGSLVVLRTGTGEPPLPSEVRAGAGGTHALGLAEVVELARALDRLPRRLVVLGVRAADFTPGAPLSPPVAAAVDTAADRVRRLLR